MKKPLEVFVLLNSESTVFAVITDETLAEEWPDYDPAYSTIGPLEVDDPDALALFEEAKADDESSDAE